MALLQALIAMIGRSASRIMNAILGWAVRALFGPTSGMQQSLLMLLVIGAAVWPLLLLGVFLPHFATFALTFIPVSDSVPTAILRTVWIVLALLVPTVIGLVLGAKAPAGTERESFGRRAIRGYQATLGIAVAFVISVVGVPIQRLASAARRHQEAVLPLLTHATTYDDVVQHIQATLNDHDFALVRTEPGFWMRAPTAAMRKLAGRALRGYVPDKVVYFQGKNLAVAIYPNSILLRGPLSAIARAQGLTAEALSATDSFQTTEASAQDLEEQIKRVWKVLDENPVEHINSSWLASRIEDMKRELLKLEVGYDDWQTLYRQLLQLGRALHGEPQLLSERGETEMEHPTVTKDAERLEALHDVPTPTLMSEIGSKVALLVSKEVELARAEIKSDLSAELASIIRLGIGVVAAVITINLLLMAAVFALAPYVGSEMMAALGLAAVMLAIALIAGALGWSKFVTNPLLRTRRTLREDLQWTKEKMA